MLQRLDRKNSISWEMQLETTRHYIVFLILNFLLKASCAEEKYRTIHLYILYGQICCEDTFLAISLKLEIFLFKMFSQIFFEFFVLYILLLWGWFHYMEEMHEICDWEVVKSTLKSLGWKNFALLEMLL